MTLAFWFARSSSDDNNTGLNSRPRAQATAAHVAHSPSAPLVARLYAGDHQALAELHQSIAAELWRYAYHLTHDRDAAEDIVQDVFVALWERRTQLSADIALRPYLFIAVRHRVLKRLRHDAIVQRATYSADLPVNTPSPAPDIAATTHTLRDIVRNALATLPERQRDVIQLRWQRHLTHTETAAILGISEAAVRKLTSKAIARLAELQRILSEP